MQYLYLTLAIVCEVIATAFLKQSNGFSRTVPAAISLVGYGAAFYLLSLTLQTMPTGIAYATWSGVGIVLVAAVSWAFHGQRLDVPAMVGMGLVIAGVVVLNLCSNDTR